MLRTLTALALAAAHLGCGDKRYLAEEPWAHAPDVRIALVHHDHNTIVALGPTEKFDISLDPDATERHGTDVWLLAYRADTLKTAFPGFASVAELAPRLRPAVAPTPGFVAPMADEILFAHLGPDTSSALQYEKKTWADLAAAGLEVRFAVETEAFCGGYTVDTFPAPAGLHLDAVAAPDEDHPMLVGSDRSSTTTASLYRFDDGTFTRVGIAGRGPITEKMAFDPKSQSLWLIDAEDRPVHLGLDAQRLPIPTLPPYRGRVPRVREVAAGLDGTVMILAQAESAGTPFPINVPFVIDLTGEWKLGFKTNEVPATPFQLLEVVGTRRAAAWTLCWISTYLDPDQTTGWNIEFADIECDRHGVPTTVRDVSGHLDQFVVVGTAGLVSFRDEESKTWPRPDDPSSGSPGPGYPELLTAAALGDGRAIVAGNEGTLLFRTHGGWCTLDPQLAGHRIFRSARSPTFETVYLIADDASRVGNSASTLIRVRL